MRRHGGRQAVQGFTLIELMIVIAVMAILAALAYPSYAQYLREARRADAMQALASLQQAQERWRAKATRYAGDSAAELTAAWPQGLGQSPLSVAGHYTIAVVGTPTGSSYVATATAVAGSSQAHDAGCTVLTVSMAQGAVAYTPLPCWRS